VRFRSQQPAQYAAKVGHAQVQKKVMRSLLTRFSAAQPKR